MSKHRLRALYRPGQERTGPKAIGKALAMTHDAQDVQERIDAASRAFEALLTRYQVIYMVETGTNSALGDFTRIVFGVAQPKPVPADPVGPKATP